MNQSGVPLPAAMAATCAAAASLPSLQAHFSQEMPHFGNSMSQIPNTTNSTSNARNYSSSNSVRTPSNGCNNYASMSSISALPDKSLPNTPQASPLGPHSSKLMRRSSSPPSPINCSQCSDKA